MSLTIMRDALAAALTAAAPTGVTVYNGAPDALNPYALVVEWRGAAHQARARTDDITLGVDCWPGQDIASAGWHADIDTLTALVVDTLHTWRPEGAQVREWFAAPDTRSLSGTDYRVVSFTITASQAAAC